MAHIIEYYWCVVCGRGIKALKSMQYEESQKARAECLKMQDELLKTFEDDSNRIVDLIRQHRREKVKMGN